MTGIVATRSGNQSTAAKHRMLSKRGEPMFYADWLRAVFIHYEVDAERLQRAVPFDLDLDQGRAYLSLVAFTMRNMRPRIGGKFSALLFRPIATHDFLNVRTYVRHRGEPGIYFLAEWLSNPLSVRLGPATFGLPYRFARTEYQHEHEIGSLRGSVTAANDAVKLEYRAAIDSQTTFGPCAANSREEFLLERYTAFTARKLWRGFFRIWHPPWPQTGIEVKVSDTSLLTEAWPWFKDAAYIGANYSPGINEVWMGRPHGMRE
ncbi:MAG: hypothetical protein JWQ04_3151 [Pedosphaera sp.]|nr:hypothetical protein [Pedosphaera sp.]